MEKKEGSGRRKDGRVIAKRHNADSHTILQEPAGIKDDETRTRLKFGILATTTVSWQSGINKYHASLLI